MSNTSESRPKPNLPPMSLPRAAKRTVLLAAALVAVTFFCAPAHARAASAVAPAQSPQFMTPTLSVPIPGLSFSQPLQKNGKLTSDFIGVYITGVYRFLLPFAAAIAIIMVMIGGLQYVLAAGSGNVKAAEDRIKNSVVGLVLLLGTYVVLYAVNPQTTLLSPIELKYVDPVQLVQQSGDEPGEVTKEGIGTIGIACNGSGDVAAIAKSFIGKTTYRFHGKGQAAPYPADKKTCDGKPCSSFCPKGTICLDCSGFVGLVASCAGLPKKGESGGTAYMFASAPKVDVCNKNSIVVGGTEVKLTPGDLFGFKPGDYEKTKEFGH